MKSFTNKVATALLAATATVAIAPAAQAQVAGIGTTTKVAVMSRSKAVLDGYAAVEKRFSAELDRIDLLGREVEELGKKLDTDGNGELSDAEKSVAANQLQTVVKSLDANKDGQLTGTELDQLRARNLPAQQIAEKQREMEGIRDPIYGSQLFVVETVSKGYEAALKSVVDAKKISLVLSPNAIQWAPPAVDITAQVVAALDRAVPSVGEPPQGEFPITQSAVDLHEQIGRILMTRAYIAAAKAQQAQQGAAPQPGQPTPTAPAPQPGTDPNADNGTGG